MTYIAHMISSLNIKPRKILLINSEEMDDTEGGGLSSLTM